nr:MAG TPA: hypothetical protein [Caudoviricetes sp.]
MKLKDLFKLETGDKVRLKGTDMIFEIVEFDEEDHKCPILVELVSGSSTVIPVIHNFMGRDPMFVIPNSAVWVYKNKKSLCRYTTYNKSGFGDLFKDHNFLTVRNLEVCA